MIGAGSWGTTVATIVSDHTPTVLWGRNAELAGTIRRRHENEVYLPGISLPESLEATSDLGSCLRGC